ncbi:lymphocyte cytosolic protein 2 isoform X2 [Mixophyes fleayi]|uniref:lymphocyte cytosolic protein 2 isoform X2 n=1 Tax=Mixophyes fleayi TaxID=3061075 RepID=UPI003F4E1C46
MDFRKVPSCTEVSSWSPEALIDYFRVCNLKDCQKLVKKQGISGKRFLEMSENDIQKFPKITVPILIRIQQEIIKKEEKKGLFPIRPETQKGQPADTSESGDDEFDSFDSDDYESPNEADEVDYESPTPINDDNDYEPPPSETENCQINPPKTNVGNSHYVDRPVPGSYTACPPNPPTRPEFSTFPVKGKTFPGPQPSSSQENHRIPKPQQQMSLPPIDRDKKPIIQLNTGKPAAGKYQPDQIKNSMLPPRPRQQVPVKPDPLRKPPLPILPSSLKSNNLRHNADAEDILMDGDDLQRQYPHRPYNSNTFPSTSPKPPMKQINSGSNTLPITDISHTGAPLLGGLPYTPYKPDNRFSEGIGNGRPPAPIPVSSMSQHMSGNNGLSSEQWYLGNISRRDAENALRSINQDGTFLVRNCSQTTTSQPYVLMVLYRNKVYNVRIRYDQRDQTYLLGSGGHETFESVSEIINFFSTTPLLLIDGKDRGSRQHCKLTAIAARSFH